MTQGCVIKISVGSVQDLIPGQAPVYLCIGCAGFSLLPGLSSSCSEWGLLSSCDARASPCCGLSC